MKMKIAILIVWILLLQEPTDAAIDDVVRCDVLHIVRDWPEVEADGFYRLTNESCDDTQYNDSYYKKIDAPERYFYRLTSGYWMLYMEACDVNHIGVTNQSTSRPWLTNFVDVGDAVTSISCVSYSESITHPATSTYVTWSLPEFKEQQPYVEYTLSVEIPPETETVVFYIDVASGDCEKGNISLYYKAGEASYGLVASHCFDDAPENVLVTYPLLDTRKWFRLLVTYDRLGELSDNPRLHVSYALHLAQLPDPQSHDLTSYPDLPTLSDGSGVVPVDEASAPTTAGLLENSTDLHVSSDLPKDPDGCNGITCYGGLRCQDGRCPCPTRQQCSDHHDFDPVCAINGHTYASPCHLRAERCGHGKDLLVIVSRGPCPPGSPTTRLSDASATTQTFTDPEIGAVIEETDWTRLAIGITAAIIIALAIAVIIAIICARRKTRKRPATVAENKTVAPPINREPKLRTYNKSRSSRPFSRSSNASFRASPKSQPRLKVDVKPNGEIDPDRFSLSGCITPLCDDPENAFSTFSGPQTDIDREDIQKNGAIPRTERPVSAADNSPAERNPDADSVAGRQPDDGNAKRRSRPPQRHSSATESKVYEINIEPGVTLEFDVESAFDDSHVTTKL